MLGTVRHRDCRSTELSLPMEVGAERQATATAATSSCMLDGGEACLLEVVRGGELYLVGSVPR